MMSSSSSSSSSLRLLLLVLLLVSSTALASGGKTGKAALAQVKEEVQQCTTLSTTLSWLRAATMQSRNHCDVSLAHVKRSLDGYDAAVQIDALWVMPGGAVKRTPYVANTMAFAMSGMASRGVYTLCLKNLPAGLLPTAAVFFTSCHSPHEQGPLSTSTARHCFALPADVRNAHEALVQIEFEDFVDKYFGRTVVVTASTQAPYGVYYEQLDDDNDDDDNNDDENDDDDNNNNVAEFDQLDTDTDADADADAEQHRGFVVADDGADSEVDAGDDDEQSL